MIPRRLLADLNLFHDASPDVVTALATRAVEVSFPADGVLFLAGAAARGWFIVIEGQVRVVRGRGARQHVIHTESPGGTLGEVPLILGEPYPATAIAAEPTRCALLDRRSLESAIAECPEIAFVITKRLAKRVSSLVARLDERSAKSVQTRLVEFLLARAKASRQEAFSVGMTQQDLAEELGTVREVISREIRRLGQAKLIASLGGGRYRIVDRLGLERIVRGGQ